MASVAWLRDRAGRACVRAAAIGLALIFPLGSLAQERALAWPERTVKLITPGARNLGSNLGISVSTLPGIVNHPDSRGVTFLLDLHCAPRALESRRLFRSRCLGVEAIAPLRSWSRREPRRPPAPIHAGCIY